MSRILPLILFGKDRRQENGLRIRLEEPAISSSLLEQWDPLLPRTGLQGSLVLWTRMRGMKIIASQTGNFERSEGQKVMENLLQAHGGEVDAVFCHNDQMALGAVQAIKAAGYKPNEDILVIGIDGEMDSFKSVIAGEMSATVVSSPMYGPITFDTVEKILAGQEVPEQTIMEGVVVDAGNAQENMELAY